ncbi:MAG: hypothetical protein IPF47_14190 [Gemmatimonadetes bacterium]|nr:hypothetical protein [Gemmatimonadota bacterium]
MTHRLECHGAVVERSEHDDRAVEVEVEQRIERRQPAAVGEREVEQDGGEWFALQPLDRLREGGHTVRFKVRPGIDAVTATADRRDDDRGGHVIVLDDQYSLALQRPCHHGIAVFARRRAPSARTPPPARAMAPNRIDSSTIGLVT